MTHHYKTHSVKLLSSLLFFFFFFTNDISSQIQSCPEDIYINLEEGETSTSVTWASPYLLQNDLPTQINGFQFIGENNGTHYFLSNNKKKWQQAKNIAENKGGQLLSIDSQDKNDYIQGILNGTKAFIGLSDNNQEGNFIWVNNSNLSYSNWNGNNGGNANNKDYVTINSNGKWTVVKNNEKAYFVIEVTSCNSQIQQISGLENGAFFPIGESIITYSSSGCGVTENCSFSIFINSNESSNENSENNSTADCMTQFDDCISVELSTMTENNNSSITYRFNISNNCNHAISNVAFSLPPNIVADSPNGNYVGQNNNFNIENTTNNPYYSIKFETIGEGIKNGEVETFEYTLPADTEVLPFITVAVKYATNVSTFEICTEQPEPTCEELSGTPCDDGDICTVNDVMDNNCGCFGTFADEDRDLVCDSLDLCPGFDDNIDVNRNGIPDGCEEDVIHLFTTPNAALLSFHAEKSANNVSFNWTTNTGFKNDYFIIERSSDAIHFMEIMKVESTEEGNYPVYYQQIDQAPKEGDNIYRIKQVYFDGTFDYTNLEKIKFDYDVSTFSLFPNPVHDHVSLNLKEHLDKACTIMLSNQFGQVLKTIHLENISDQQISLNTNEYKAGLYLISIQVEGKKRSTKKFIINKL